MFASEAKAADSLAEGVWEGKMAVKSEAKEQAANGDSEHSPQLVAALAMGE